MKRTKCFLACATLVFLSVAFNQSLNGQTVLYPTASNVGWRMGWDYTVSWSGFSPGLAIRIDLYKGSTLNRTITSSTENDGYFIWTVPLMEAATDYRIRVSQYLGGMPIYVDYSDNYFTIANPQVTYPSVSGIVWAPGSSYNITWSGFIESNVRIDLYKGSSAYATIESSTANDGSYTFTVPTTLPVADDYRIRISSTTISTIYDYSNYYFSIAASPQVLYPSASGITWYCGENYNITWSGFYGSDVKIELFKGSSLFQTIASSTPNDGAYSWTVYNTWPHLYHDYYIRITSLTNGVYDNSNYYFSIALPVLGNTTVYSSVSNQNYRRAMPVTFTRKGAIQSISIYHNGGSGGVMLGVYSDASSTPSSRLGVTASATVSSTAGWQTIPLTAPVEVSSGQTVWLAWVFETSPGIRYTTGTPARAQSTATYSGGMPATFGTAAYANYKYSVYCNYIPGYIDVAPTSVSLGYASGSTGTFTLSTNITTWAVQFSANWINIDSEYRVPGTDNIIFTLRTLSANTGTSPRSGTFTFSANGLVNKTVTVTQEGQSSDTKTLGNTAVYTSVSSNIYRKAVPVTFAEAGSINSMSIYHNGGSGHMLMGVYSDASAAPSTRLGVTASTTVNASAGWQTVSLSSPVAVTSGQTVWLSWVFETAVGCRYTSGTPAKAQSTASWSGGMPTTFGTAAFANVIYSIYCTYTPGISDKTLGNTTVYSSVSSNIYRKAVPVTFAEAGSIKSMSIYHNGGSGHVLMGVYSNASAAPSTRLGVTASTTVNASAGWQTVSLSSPVAVTSGQTVWLSWVFETSVGCRYTSGTPAKAQSTASWAGGMPATFGTAAFANVIYSVYCTYTPSQLKSGGGPVEFISIETVKEEVLIYPNPTDGGITVSWNNNYERGLTLTIYNSVGSLVKTVQVQPQVNEINIDLSDTKPGIYLLQLKNNMNGIIVNNSRIIKN